MKEEAVSETVGAIILILVAVLAMGIVILVLSAGPLPTRVPSFTGLISNDSKSIYISHEGGDPLWRGQYKILVDGVDRTSSFVGPDPFTLGKNLSYTPPAMNASRVVMIFNTSWGGGSVLLSADLARRINIAPYGWYNGDWLYRMKITFNHTNVAADQTDFPVLISKQFTNLSQGMGKARIDANDILFTSSDGMTKLPHEIESFTSNDGTIVTWVKVPSLSSTTDTVIYLYYGNLGASSQQNPTGVWDANFKGVWHMNNNNIYDSTSHSYAGTNYGTTDTAGKIGQGRDFDGTSTWINTPSTELATAADFTITAWFRTDATDFAHHLIWQGNVTGNGWAEWPDRREDELHISMGNYVDPSSYSNRLTFFLGDTDSGQSAGALDLNSSFSDTSNWHYVAVRATGVGTDSAWAALLQDGGQIASDTGTAARTVRRNYTSLRFGRPGDNERYFNGVLDEIRVSNIARTPQWIATEYANQNNPGVGGFLLSYSTEQTQTAMS